MNLQPVVAIDFDKTIYNSEFPEVGVVFKTAREYINLLHRDGYYIVINSCRTLGIDVETAKFALKADDIKYDKFNENNPSWITAFGNDSRKIGADIYIDDKSLIKLPMNEDEVDWEYIYKLVNDKLGGKLEKYKGEL